MAYSGTVGQTRISVQQMIDHGARRCGKLAEELAVEQVQSAKESLYILLSNIANTGINYWAISKTVLGLMPHPERLAEDLLGGRDGKAMFDSLVEALS